jgi:signal-transduction protein with cAMP-binding, CBS, and nucleotidyltransferase domain
MRVSELMHTPPVTCTPRATVGDVARLMASRNVGSVIIIDEVGEVSGIVTDRDIAMRGVAQGRSADIPVEAVLTRDVATIEPAADLADAASRMLKRNVRRLPVVDEHGEVHGLVALDDLVRNVGRQADELGDLLFSQASTLSVEP